MAFKLLNIIGLAVTVAGVGLNLASEWVKDQKEDEKINNIIDEKLAQHFENEEES